MRIFKNNLVVFLMAMSQVLLTLFVLYWLMGQFNAEKHSLYRELNRGFDTSERMMIDSLLATHLINPILNDSSKYTLRFGFSSDSMNSNVLHPNTATARSLNPIDFHRRVNVIDINKNDSIFMTDSSILHISTATDTNQSMLYQGVGMFVKRIEGMGFRRSGRSSFFSSYADTLVLKKSFINFLQERDYDFSVQWITGKENIKVTHKGIMLTGRVFGKSFAVYVEDFQSHLITAIIPQIIFALVLLLITLASFRISHLNIKKQKRLLEIKNEFISNITHELKTPVATVKVALEALLDFDMKKDPEVVQDYLEMSLLEMNRLDMLVSKVLNNSVMENGANLFNPEEEDLKLLIEEVLKSQQHRLKKSGASLSFKSELDEAFVMVDKIHLQGVLLNLIDNSLKYSSSQIIIKLDLSQRAKSFVISIKDNGPGIPNEYLDKVFDKFFRVPTQDKHNVKGYGLGLNYAKLVIQHHKGSISVRNLSEGGCEFIVKIPIIES